MVKLNIRYLATGLQINYSITLSIHLSIQDELHALVDVLHSAEKSNNLRIALNKIDRNGDGKIDYSKKMFIPVPLTPFSKT